MEISELHLTPITQQEDDTFKVGNSHVTRAQLEQMRDHIQAALDGVPPKPAPVKPAEPKKVYEIVTLKNGNIAIVTPYSDIVVQECKRLMGKWKSFQRGESLISAWILDGSHKDHMTAFLADLYDGAKVEKIVTFEGEASDYAPEIDGARLLTFSRDHRSRINHDAVLEIIEDRLVTGGSARYPTIRGTLKIRVRVRDNAVIEWAGGNVTVEAVNAGA